MTESLLTTPEAADYLKVSPRTLQDWAKRGVGPRVLRAGRQVRYRRADIDAWLDAQSTPEDPK